jgi:hypothetical protein
VQGYGSPKRNGLLLPVKGAAIWPDNPPPQNDEKNEVIHPVWGRIIAWIFHISWLDNPAPPKIVKKVGGLLPVKGADYWPDISNILAG